MPETSGLLPGIPGKRCAHCNTQTTPLWRNGPDGPKTLCNACGVRDNRRHAKTRNAASRPRPRKPAGEGTAARAKPRPAGLSSRRLDASGVDALGGRRSARWNAGLLAKQAKADADEEAAAARARKRLKVSNAAAAAARARDVGPDGTIFTPGAREVETYDAPVGFVPSARYVSSRPEGVAGRFAPGGPAPLYNATEADQQWLQGVNAPRAQSEHLLVGQLENLFDVFEEAGWHSGETPGSARDAYDVLGYSTSVAEAEAAVKAAIAGAGAFGLGGDLSWADEGDLFSPALAVHEGASAWDAVQLQPREGKRSETFAEGSDRSYTPPLTPNGSVEPAFVAALSSKGSEDGSVGAGSPGSVPSNSADTEEDQSDAEEAAWGSKSGNGKSSDLAARVGSIENARVTRAGKKIGRSNAGPLEVIKGTGELENDIINRRTNRKNVGVEEERHHKKNKNAARGAGARRYVPTAEDAELVFGHYRALRERNGGVALLPRFERPAPPQIRARAQLGGGAGDFAEDDEGDDADVCEYQFVLGYEGVRRQQRERAERAEAVAAAARRRRRRACFNPAASKRRRKQQAAMEVAIEAPLTIVHEPLFPDAAEAEETHAIAADADGNVAENDEPAAKDAESDWETDDDVPLAALADRDAPPEPTLAELAAEAAAREAEEAETFRLAKLRAKLEAKIEARRARLAAAAAGEPSVMRKVASAASCVLSRFMGKPQSQPLTLSPSRPAASMMHPIDSPATPKKRRTPRFGGDRDGGGSHRVPSLGGAERRVAVKTEA